MIIGHGNQVLFSAIFIHASFGGAVVRWFDGSMVRWFDGLMVRWFGGSVVVLFNSKIIWLD